MASSLRKLLTRAPPSRLLFSLYTQQSPNLTTPPLLLNHQTRIETEPDHPHLFSCSLPQTKEKLTHLNSSFFYPSFRFGLCLDPIVSTGSIHSEPDDDVCDCGSEIMWADSVKKKRKKKMNKHKYKKLRKSLRRQT